MNGFKRWLHCGIYIILQGLLITAIPICFAVQIHNEFDDDPIQKQSLAVQRVKPIGIGPKYGKEFAELSYGIKLRRIS